MVREERLRFIVRTQENSHTPFGTDPRIGCALHRSHAPVRSAAVDNVREDPFFRFRGILHFVPGPRMDVRLSGFCRVETSPGSWPK